MMVLEQIELFPTLLRIETLPEDILYIGVAGFEDRSLGFLKEATKSGKKFGSCIAIDYRPFDSRNRKAEFADYAATVFGSVLWKIYDRGCPENFTHTLQDIVGLSGSVSRIVVDVSAMSKMLVVVLLHGLKTMDLPLSIIYAPARIYHPLREKYEKVKSTYSDAFPYFLTTDVYKVVTTTELSSIAMQGAPLVIVAFPNFNHLEIAALLNETNAQKLFLIESIRDPHHNPWRLDAIRWINRGLKAYATPICYETDASDINANIAILDKIYNEFHLTHKIALSPTGGKLQAIATFCLKNMHPDIHIVYPVVREFEQDYTEGYLTHSEIFFPSFRVFADKLNRHRMIGLFEIREILKSIRQKDLAR